jgi:ribosome biogenesis protein ERB1
MGRSPLREPRSKLVKAIREGRILPYKAPEEREDKEEELINYDLWAWARERRSMA